MLCSTSYPRQYVAECRDRIDAQVVAFRRVRSAVDGVEPRPAAELDTFEPVFFNNLVLALDAFFTHRGRGMEGKDGNPLNEVRVLCTALTTNHGIVAVDKTIRMDPARTVLGLRAGDAIALREEDFTRLARAFLDELEARYVTPASAAS